jgi:hypothetical protein
VTRADTFEAIMADYIALAMRYHRKEITPAEARAARIALEARYAALTEKETARV